jgi:cell wall-associated NlpC family hydrolase
MSVHELNRRDAEARSKSSLISGEDSAPPVFTRGRLLRLCGSTSEPDQRAGVIDEAKTWLGTPYHHAARVKGAGVDCATLPAEVYAAAGMIPALDLDHYPPDWHLHRSAERYLAHVLDHAREVPAPTGPGDFVLYKWGRAFAHGAIVVSWPTIIHAMIHVGVVLDAGDDGRLKARERRFFTLWDR